MQFHGRILKKVLFFYSYTKPTKVVSTTNKTSGIQNTKNQHS